MKKKKLDKEQILITILYDVLPLLLMVAGLALVIGAFYYYSR